VTEKVTKLIKGAVVGIVAGIFMIFGLFLLLDGFAWLAYWAIPFPEGTYFWGFFVVAAVLFLLGALGGYIAARAMKSGAPPTPVMAIDEAKLIKETVQSKHPERTIESNRMELAHSLTRLRGEVAEITDWRKQIAQHQKQVLIGAAVAGFVIGGGIAAVGGLFRRRR